MICRFTASLVHGVNVHSSSSLVGALSRCTFEPQAESSKGSGIVTPPHLVP